MLGSIIKWTILAILIPVVFLFTYGFTEALLEDSLKPKQEMVLPEVVIKVEPIEIETPAEPHYWDSLSKQDHKNLITIYGSEEKARLTMLLIIIQGKLITGQDATYEQDEYVIWNKRYLETNPAPVNAMKAVTS